MTYCSACRGRRVQNKAHSTKMDVLKVERFMSMVFIRDVCGEEGEPYGREPERYIDSEAESEQEREGIERCREAEERECEQHHGETHFLQERYILVPSFVRVHAERKCEIEQKEDEREPPVDIVSVCHECQ